MANNIDCPVDNIQVNENKVRLVALLVIMLMLIYMCMDWWSLVAFLLIDFTLRAFNLGKLSILGITASLLVKQLNLSNKPVDQAPKRFAAGVGAAFCLLILLAGFSGWHGTALSLSIVLLVFAILESFMGFCAGCYVYSFLLRLKIIR